MVLIGMGLGEEGVYTSTTQPGSEQQTEGISEEREMLIPFHFGCTVRRPHGFGVAWAPEVSDAGGGGCESSGPRPSQEIMGFPLLLMSSRFVHGFGGVPMLSH